MAIGNWWHQDFARPTIGRIEIIHRDLKPSNVMLIEKEGNPNFVKLLDFGLAKTEFQTKLTKTGKLMGTINYMSPEQLAHSDFFLASDIYSLGVTFYEILTSKKAFHGKTTTDTLRLILDKMPEEPRKFRKEIPTELNQLIMNMLDKNPNHRPTAEQVLAAIKKISNS